MVQARYSAALLEGLTAAKSGRSDQAIEWYRKALTHQPTAEAHYNLSVTWLRMNKNREALEACDAALKLDAGYMLAHLNRGNALMYLGRYREAVKAYEEALRLDPNSEMTAVNLKRAKELAPR
jgi:tetratricopeptide (TPR) repeat protein